MTDYFKIIETFVYQDKKDHIKFLFKLFDVFNEDKITEAGLFKFMEDSSLRRSDANPNPTDILALNQEDNDIFLDIFSDFYAKIVEALSRKSKKMNLKTQAEMLAIKVRNLRPNG